MKFYPKKTIIIGINKGCITMADIKSDDFLLQYFMQMRFNAMPPEIRARYDAYSKNDDFRGHMKEWKKYLMMPDGSKKPLPDPNGPDYHLNDEQWNALFLEFQSAFRKMAENRKNFTNAIDFSVNNDKIINFLDEYFGFGKLFDKASAGQAAETQITDLASLLNTHKSILEIKLQEWGLLDSGFKYKNLLDGIKDKKYNTDSEFQGRLINVAKYITSYTQSNSYYADNELINKISNHNFNEIINGFDDEAIVPNKNVPNKLAAFKQEYDILLHKLYSNNAIRDAFPSDKIKDTYNRAKENVNYDDPNSKDYIPPKRKDDLTLPQRISEWADDTYADVLEKYLKFKGDRLYFSPQAKQIVAAIHKAKIKPTDGLGKIMDSADTIKKELLYKSPEATEHFEWFEKTMEDIKNTMPNAFEGALKNGTQLKAIVSELIMTAVRDNKIEEAKTAMETLSVIKYGYTTSKIMDAFNSQEFVLFSDKELSWIKSGNEATKIVATAMDKSIKKALQVAGYGVTAAVNAIKLSGSKFKGVRGRLKKEQEQWTKKTVADKAFQQKMTQRLNAQNQTDINKKRNEQQQLNQALQRGQQAINNINDYNAQKSALETAQNQDNADKAALEQRANDPTYQNALANVTRHNELTNEYNDCIQQRPRLIREINTLDTQINNIQADPTITQIEKDVRCRPLIESKIQNENKLDNIQQRLQNIPGELSQITSNPNWVNEQRIVQQFNIDTQALQSRISQNESQQSRLNQWYAAEKNINELNEQIDKRKETMRKWDKNHTDQYKELMAYWDMLETGRDTHTGKMYNWFKRLSAEEAQKQFDTNKNTYISDHLSGYSIDA